MLINGASSIHLRSAVPFVTLGVHEVGICNHARVNLNMVAVIFYEKLLSSSTPFQLNIGSIYEDAPDGRD